MRKIIFIAAAFLLTGCLTSQIVSTWKAESLPAIRSDTVLIVGILRDADRNLRERMEAHIAGDLASLGYTAYTATKKFGTHFFLKTPWSTAKQALDKAGIHSIITVVLMGKAEPRYLTCTPADTLPCTKVQNRFADYFASANTLLECPTWYAFSTVHYWESNLFDLANERLLFSVQTTSFDAVSDNALAHEFAQKMVQRMVKEKVLEKHPPASARIATGF